MLTIVGRRGRSEAVPSESHPVPYIHIGHERQAPSVALEPAHGAARCVAVRSEPRLARALARAAHGDLDE